LPTTRTCYQRAEQGGPLNVCNGWKSDIPGPMSAMGDRAYILAPS
jgi:hypothetical protein